MGFAVKFDSNLPDKAWHPMLTELQMAMYDHPVNAARESYALTMALHTAMRAFTFTKPSTSSSIDPPTLSK